MTNPLTNARDGAIAAALAAVLGFVAGGAGMALGAFVSAAFFAANMVALGWIIGKLTAGSPVGAALLPVKSVLVFVIAWLIFSATGPEAFVLGLLCGLGAACIRALLGSATVPPKSYLRAPPVEMG
jgi:hypothetical protein